MALLRKDRIWPTAIVVVLLGNLLLGIVLFRVAGDDKHFAVEPDYYRKAVAWDSTMARAERSAALGWRVVPRIGALQVGSPSMLTVAVSDAAGAPIADAEVVVDALPIAYASEVTHVTLPPGSPAGEYVGALPMARSGIWELIFVISRGTEQFTTSIRMEVTTDGPATIVTARPGDPVP